MILLILKILATFLIIIYVALPIFLMVVTNNKINWKNYKRILEVMRYLK